MIISLNTLNYQNQIDIFYKVGKDANLDKRIIDLKDAYVKGFISKNDDDIHLNVIFEGKMVILDSITLKEVFYDFQIPIEEDLKSLEENYNNVYKNNQNTLDLKAILWQNIVLEVPISYTECVDANLKGEGWELVSDENKTSDEIDPRLKKLEDLLKGDD